MNKIHQFEWGASNWFLITGGEPVMVDTGTGGSRENFESLCASCGVRPAEISLIIISHEHADHFANLDWTKHMTGGAPVVCHRAAEESLREGILPDVAPRNDLGEQAMLDPPFLGPVPKVCPDITFEGEFDLRSYGIAGSIISTPGHSDGSTAIILDDGQAIVGDTVVRPHGGDGVVAAFLANDAVALGQSLVMLMSRASVFYSGHGGPFTREEVMAALEGDDLWKELHLNGRAST